MAIRATAFILATVLLAGLAGSPSNAQTAETSTAVQKIQPSGMERKESPKLPGVSAAFIVGAFDQPGLYAAYSVMKKGSSFPLHEHPDIRMTVVVSGTMYLGNDTGGEIVAYPAGTIAITPAGTPHSMVARDGDFAVLEIGSGPSATKFIEQK